jgi:hypothetical protein
MRTVLIDPTIKDLFVDLFFWFQRLKPNRKKAMNPWPWESDAANGLRLTGPGQCPAAALEPVALADSVEVQAGAVFACIGPRTGSVRFRPPPGPFAAGSNAAIYQ